MSDPVRILVGGVEVPYAYLKLDPVPELPPRQLAGGRFPWRPWPEAWEGVMEVVRDGSGHAERLTPGGRLVVENAFADFDLAGYVVKREMDQFDRHLPPAATFRVRLNEFVARGRA